eukprot:8088943-Ditylum_brightwellii.AAC.1
MTAILRGVKKPYRRKVREEAREAIHIIGDREVGRLQKERIQYPIKKVYVMVGGNCNRHRHTSCIK